MAATKLIQIDSLWQLHSKVFWRQIYQPMENGHLGFDGEGWIFFRPAQRYQVRLISPWPVVEVKSYQFTISKGYLLKWFFQCNTLLWPKPFISGYISNKGPFPCIGPFQQAQILNALHPLLLLSTHLMKKFDRDFKEL